MYNNTSVVIKECKACLKEFLQNDKLGYYSVPRPFPLLQKGKQCQASTFSAGYKVISTCWKNLETEIPTAISYNYLERKFC